MTDLCLLRVKNRFSEVMTFRSSGRRPGLWPLRDTSWLLCLTLHVWPHPSNTFDFGLYPGLHWSSHRYKQCYVLRRPVGVKSHMTCWFITYFRSFYSRFASRWSLMWLVSGVKGNGGWLQFRLLALTFSVFFLTYLKNSSFSNSCLNESWGWMEPQTSDLWMVFLNDRADPI